MDAEGEPVGHPRHIVDRSGDIVGVVLAVGVRHLIWADNEVVDQVPDQVHRS